MRRHHLCPMAGLTHTITPSPGELWDSDRACKSKRRTEASGAAFASAGRETGSASKYLRMAQADFC